MLGVSGARVIVLSVAIDSDASMIDAAVGNR
jgi:hypothetical protein